MKPALTREEWERCVFERDGEEYVEKENDGTPFETSSYGQSAELWDESLNISDTVWHGDARHALSAFCLHNQPFGFTREDVESLRIAAEEWEQAGDMGHYWANGLANRIEALLPPKQNP